MQPPFFSIVTACKNGLDYFKATAPTIIGQSFKNWEWIFVDDGSVEPVSEYLASFNDPRIRILKNEVSIQQTKSLNRGIKESKADWIVRMDGDDLARKDRLDRLHTCITTSPSPLALIFSNYRVIDEVGTIISEVKYNSVQSKSFNAYLMNRNNPICHPTVAFRKLNRAGEINLFNESLKNAQDYELWKRIITTNNAKSFTHIPDALIDYRIVSTSLSGARIKEQVAELKEIRNSNSTDFISDIPIKTIGVKSRNGMYGYRYLYYRFIGSSKDRSYTLRDCTMLLASLQYLPVVPKAFLFFCLRPFRSLISKLFFGNIYLYQ